MQSYDVFFLSHRESSAQENFELLKNHCSPIHVSGIDGIYNAHKACADQSSTSRFFVVDADSVMIPLPSGQYFDFTIGDDVVLKDRCVYIWDAVNSVNKLVYGYGGVKLFAKSQFTKNSIDYVDMSSTVGALFGMKQCISETRFNSSPFDAWKAGFREACKLQHAINNEARGLTDRGIAWVNNTRLRLDAWCTLGHTEKFGTYCINGAKQGVRYANKYSSISAVNNFVWLKSHFDYIERTGKSCI